MLRFIKCCATLGKTTRISEKPFIHKATDFKDVIVGSLKNFSIHYKASEEQIIVTAFWDNRQNPKKLLEIVKNEK